MITHIISSSSFYYKDNTIVSTQKRTTVILGNISQTCARTEFVVFSWNELCSRYSDQNMDGYNLNIIEVVMYVDVCLIGTS